MSRPAGSPSRLDNLDVAVPSTSLLGKGERKRMHAAWVDELGSLSGAYPCVRFALEALSSLVSDNQQLQRLVAQQVDDRASAAADAQKLHVLLMHDAAGGYSSALALAAVLRARL